MATSHSSDHEVRAPGPLAGRRVLVANRGEIACRILRAVREEGALGIAVYSDADRGAPHVRLADEAHRIGPAPAAQSYLDPAAVLAACARSRAEMLHPGYGFLAENADFAEAVGRAGVIWIGPPPAAMRALGDKIAARRAMAAAGVPIVPGTTALPPDPAAAHALASTIGYPVLIKAAAGGGGRGMRACADRDELTAALELSRREAERAFGDGTVYLEKLVESPRHIEVQVLADHAGATIHLGERECSIQRRHQKLLEECPAARHVPGLRGRIGAAAVTVARSAGYASAGTVEFLVDATGSFYFLEMNTRLQVEHPVTEMVTGVDLVRRQLRIAAGVPLDLRQEEVTWRGHAIECRINAEDPENAFRPSTGRIAAVHLPNGPGIRNDNGFLAGTTVTPYYDPLLGKMIAWGEDRAHAIARALRGLAEYRIAGVRTNLAFHRWLLAHPRFAHGDLHTGFLDQEYRAKDVRFERDETTAVLAAAWAAARASAARPAYRTRGGDGAWKRRGRPGAGGAGWR